MITAPPIINRPPPVPTQRHKVPTFVYAGFFLPLFFINMLLVFAKAAYQMPGNLAYAIGAVMGGALFPLVLVAGIASIWKINRGFRGIVRVLFWASLVLPFAKFGEIGRARRSQPDSEQESHASVAEESVEFARNDIE